MTPAPLAFRHQKVQRLRRLAGRRSARQAERAFVVEGAKVLTEALDAGAAVEAVFAGPGAPAGVLDRVEAAGIRVHELAPGVLERVADTVTPQPLAAIVGYHDVPLDALQSAGLLVVLVDVRDPGNAGTVLRSAAAAGAAGVISCDGSVDLYNPKTVRASAGTMFHVPIVVGADPADVVTALGRWGLRRFGTVARGGLDYDSCDLRGPVAIILGNEATGIPDGVAEALDGWLTIPMAGPAESLNVGMAAAVLCFEAARQRRRGS